MKVVKVKIKANLFYVIIRDEQGFYLEQRWVIVK